jgi:NitT/TauT family transport system ATP-binding protein
VAAVSVAGVGKRYARQVLEQVSFELQSGALTVLMGPSGCGKTTLACMLAGYVAPDAGTLAIDGRPITTAGPDRLMVFQETALWHWMTVLENVMFGPRAAGTMSAGEARRKARELLERFGLADFRDKYPGQLSGGMRRRVELAQAMINNPRLMILDEPFRGLDVMTRGLMQEYYLKLFAESRMTTLFITSELEEALVVGERVLVMDGAPARIARSIDVELPYPRTPQVLASERYLETKKALMAALYSPAHRIEERTA